MCLESIYQILIDTDKFFSYYTTIYFYLLVSMFIFKQNKISHRDMALVGVYNIFIESDAYLSKDNMSCFLRYNNIYKSAHSTKTCSKYHCSVFKKCMKCMHILLCLNC